jgi:hypothetical protein
VEPAPATSAQGRLFAVVEECGDLSQRYVRMGKVTFGKISAGLVLDRFEGGAFFA